MDDQLTISTPEQVAFHYEVAGIGTRFQAALLDHLIIVLTLVLFNCAAAVLGVGSVFGGVDQAVVWIYALLILINFLVLWGYFALFEMVWNGQTPGKRSGRLRVIRRDGQPIHAGEALTRNLVRIIDFLPFAYGIGLIAMFIDKDARRLGDFAASTIVVREGEQTQLRDVSVARPRQEATVSPYATPTYSYPYAQQAIQANDPLPGISLRDLTPEDYQLMREMVTRSYKSELSSERVEELATRLAYGVASRLGHDFREWERRGWRPLTFLESVLAAKDARGE